MGLQQIPQIAQNMVLPACLVLLTLAIDLPGVIKLGPLAVGMFLVATTSIVAGGPLTVLLFRLIWPGAVQGDLIWRGMSTLAGDWIGGGANMLAMREIFHPCPEGSTQPGDEGHEQCVQWREDYETLFAQVVTIDVIASNIWLACLVYIIKAKLPAVDGWLGGNTDFINELKQKLAGIALKNQRIASFLDLVNLASVGFFTMAAATYGAAYLAPALLQVAPVLEKLSLTSQFFWLVVMTTTAGLLCSFTELRTLEGAGASRIGTLLLYILVVSIGMQMNILDAFRNPALFLLTLVWLLLHVFVLIGVAKLVKVRCYKMLPHHRRVCDPKSEDRSLSPGPLNGVLVGAQPCMRHVGAVLFRGGGLHGKYWRCSDGTHCSIRLRPRAGTSWSSARSVGLCSWDLYACLLLNCCSSTSDLKASLVRCWQELFILSGSWCVAESADCAWLSGLMMCLSSDAAACATLEA